MENRDSNFRVIRSTRSRQTHCLHWRFRAQSSGTLKNAKARQNYSIFAETTPQRKATIQRTHSNKKESQSEEEKAAKKRLKRPKKRVLGADFTAFGPFPFLSLALTLQRGPQTIITIAPRRLKHRMRELWARKVVESGAESCFFSVEREVVEGGHDHLRIQRFPPPQADQAPSRRRINAVATFETSRELE